jgi:cytosine deaminase
MDNYYVSKLIPLMAEAQINVIPNPLINIMLQGRHESYPKRRGMTRVRELMDAGLNVAFGQDCTMDPWYSMGSADMLAIWRSMWRKWAVSTIRRGSSRR